ncbi:hypothetical protein RHMOL_Rhmol07G0226300 [Rhododendron molle]|uniref:Uncharacterized protein n=1 Tax=Rhododendron molle TaxID=49168 RepID=A0ACC0N4B0_RHOML|nr:hypothetical protein RHMOL_Rhmol07G0226300 [Rhododendron molle]
MHFRSKTKLGIQLSCLTCYNMVHRQGQIRHQLHRTRHLRPPLLQHHQQNPPKHPSWPMLLKIKLLFWQASNITWPSCSKGLIRPRLLWPTCAP